MSTIKGRSFSSHKTRLAEGFTLIELMVVVGIIGILSAVAIPSFSNYQAGARQTEAKIALSGIYVGELSQMATTDNYTPCLQHVLGADQHNGSYYTIGFTAGTETKVAGTCDFDFPPSNHQDGFGITDPLDFTGTYAQETTEFLVGALGVIQGGYQTSTLADIWTIDENKDLKNFRKGY